jgi:hypothetical protein
VEAQWTCHEGHLERFVTERRPHGRRARCPHFFAECGHRVGRGPRRQDD